MKLSFLPGELYLSEEKGVFVVTLNSAEILRTRSQQRALSKFNELRREMEQRFPTRDLTPEEMRTVLQQVIADSLVGVNPKPKSKKKHSSARGTRTFGG